MFFEKTLQQPQPKKLRTIYDYDMNTTATLRVSRRRIEFEIANTTPSRPTGIPVQVARKVVHRDCSKLRKYGPHAASSVAVAARDRAENKCALEPVLHVEYSASSPRVRCVYGFVRSLVHSHSGSKTHRTCLPATSIVNNMA